MNRRVLINDVDADFYGRLMRQLGPYQIVVSREPDPERALARCNADPPDLVMIAVEDPEKHGFKTLTRFRKLVPDVPIVLVTSTVPPETFAQHRALKVRADEYIDKRSLTLVELIAKLEKLIGLIATPAEELSDLASEPGDFSIEFVTDVHTVEGHEPLGADAVKIGELQRRIVQLELECERARAATKRASRASQFVGLREASAAQEQELEQLKTTLQEREHELAEANARLAELAANLRGTTLRATDLQRELDSKAKIAASAETEQRRLGREREQLVAHHATEVAAMRTKAASEQKIALSQMRAELEAAFKTQVEDAVEAAKTASAAEREGIVANHSERQQHDEAAYAAQLSSHVETIARIREEHSTAIEALEASYDKRVATRVAEHTGKLAEL